MILALLPHYRCPLGRHGRLCCPEWRPEPGQLSCCPPTHPMCFCLLSQRLGAYLIMINRCLDNQIQHQKVGDDSPRTLGRKQGIPGVH